MTDASLELLRAQANAIVSDLYIGRPGISGFGKHDASTVSGYPGNIAMAINNTVDAIMANGTPEEIEQSIETFKHIAEEAADIYDQTHEAALELFQDPEVAEAYQWLVEGGATAEELANKLAGMMAEKAFGVGNYIPITGNPEEDRQAMQNGAKNDRIEDNISEAKSTASDVIERVRSGEIQSKVKADNASEQTYDESAMSVTDSELANPEEIFTKNPNLDHVESWLEQNGIDDVDPAAAINFISNLDSSIPLKTLESDPQQIDTKVFNELAESNS